MNMFNTLRNESIRTASLRAALAALLLSGGGMATAATVSVDLCATSGVTSGTAIAPAIPVWGYVLSSSCPTTPPLTALPAVPAVISVNLGDDVTVILHNGLAETTGLLFQGQSLIPDTTGIGTGGNKTYTFTASRAGTYLFQAAPLPNAEHQVAMGLYGALVVRSPDISRTDAGVSTVGSLVVTDTGAVATDVGSKVSGPGIPVGATVASVIPGTSFSLSLPADGTAGSGSFVLTKGSAYGGEATAFADEALLVLSEIDPALNTSATPATFDMRTFAPKYFLINGKAFPDTAEISSGAGHKLLLRYVNAGAKHHSMGALGLRQNFIAKDGNLLPTAAVAVTAETLATGQTGDALVSMPAGAAGRFAVYDAGLALHNSSAPGFGGMLTFVKAAAGAAPPTGPTTSVVAAAPNSTNGSTAVVLTATVTSASTTTVTAAEYFVDVKGADGSGAAMGGTFGSVAVPVNASVLLGVARPTGNHSLLVHGQDATGAWGAIKTVSVTLDHSGPTTTVTSLTPNPTTGTVNVSLVATASDSASGGSNVTAAEYTVDGGPVQTVALVDAVTPVRSLTATIAPPVGGFTTGAHNISIRSKDALGNWGLPAVAALTVQAAGPATTSVTMSPNPNNGSLPLSASQPVLRVTASVTASGTGNYVTAMEGFLNPSADPATTVRGFPFTPSDGTWNTLTETGYADIPLANISGFATGTYPIKVRGKDATGAWGATLFTGILVIDKTPPTVSSVTLSRSSSGTQPVTVTAVGVDSTCLPATCGISSGEYYLDAAGAAGTGTAMAMTPSTSMTNFSAVIPGATVQGLSQGTHGIYVRAKDRSGNWSTGTVNASLIVDHAAPTFSSATLTPNTVRFGTPTSVTVNFAAADTGGSGLVAGGQYWLDATNPPANAATITGTAATFTTSATLTGGTHNVRIRVTDAAGNATVRSVPLYVVQAVNDTRTGNPNGIAATTAPTQTNDSTANQYVLTNDQPAGVAGRTSTLTSAPVRNGTGAGTLAVSCPAALGTAATPAVLGNTICTNGAYRVTLTGVGTNGAQLQSSKRGTFSFTYTETLNGVTSAPATVSITVN